MQVVYLNDGTKANLIAKTDKGFVVDPISIYQDYDSEEEYEEASGNVKMVDKVYEKAPKEVIGEEYRVIHQKVEEQEKLLSEKRSELNKVNYELGQIQKQKTDLAKMIINRTELANAKRLIVWVNGCIAPRIMDKKNSLKLTVSYTISQYGNAEEKCWAYSVWSEYSGEERWSTYSEYFDPEYGVKADLTDEEVLQITHERQIKNKYDGRELERTSEKWLTPGNIEKRNEYIQKSNESQLKQAESDLIAAQEKLDKLKKIALTVS